ncbi:MAG: hypothetical protein JWR29_43 [Tardiphaga sp.]|nr:hypothetical protein [Tardiphaga sp.]
MSTSSAFPGFDGLMRLSRREGVDVRPTLLRVLTDLYVQASAHTADEEQQFVELASRLIDAVDDATRAAVRARLSIYPHTPQAILTQLSLRPAQPKAPMPRADLVAAPTAPTAPAVSRPPTEAQLRAASQLAMQPKDAADIAAMFFAAGRSERGQILANLLGTPLRPSARIAEARAADAIKALEAAAFAADVEAFTAELGSALMLPSAITAQIVADPGREPLACALKALGMPAEIFQRVLMFLDPVFGSSVDNVYRLSRFYDVLRSRAALIMLAAWRGATLAATRAKYKPSLYDDERSRPRSTTQARPAVQQGHALPGQKFSTGH